MVIEKSESVMLRLKEIADIGFHHRRWRAISGTQFSFISKRYCESGSWRSWREYRVEHFGNHYETLKSLYDPL
jgi:hypothetical protein